MAIERRSSNLCCRNIGPEIYQLMIFFASGETSDYYLVLVMFLAMQYLKHMSTDHSCIENSDIENKHLIFENHFRDQNQKPNTPPDRLTAHRSALPNLTITYIQLYRAQYSTSCPSWLSNEYRVTCAVGISD